MVISFFFFVINNKELIIIIHIVEDGSELMLESTPYVDLDLAKKRFKEIVDDDERKMLLDN